MLISHFIGLLCLHLLSNDILLMGQSAAASRASKRDAIPCETPKIIQNANMRFRRNNSVLRVQCLKHYTLVGPKFIHCVNGKWYDARPLCAKQGCALPSNKPEHGYMQNGEDYEARLYCQDDYVVSGNQETYCNGTHWDRELGNCREKTKSAQHECDFETEDLCGWETKQLGNYRWRRVRAANEFGSFHTGPRHDHTTMTSHAGHYMLMESFERLSKYMPLISPVYKRELSLKTATCFRFFYFMYGVGVADLFVLVKPMSMSMLVMLSSIKELAKFSKSGNQNQHWHEGLINIEKMSEDFQVIFVVKSGTSHLSDIAIDDVKLMFGDDCNENVDTTENVDTGTDEAPYYDTQSCVSRCGETTDLRVEDHIGEQQVGNCNCHYECENDQSCCPDYRSKCLNEVFAESTSVSKMNDATSFVQSTDISSTTKIITTPTIPKPLSSTKTSFTTPKIATTSQTTTRNPITTKVTARTIFTTITTSDESKTNAILGTTKKYGKDELNSKNTTKISWTVPDNKEQYIGSGFTIPIYIVILIVTLIVVGVVYQRYKENLFGNCGKRSHLTNCSDDESDALSVTYKEQSENGKHAKAVVSKRFKRTNYNNDSQRPLCEDDYTESGYEQFSEL